METPPLLPTREQLIHALYEAAEIEHNLMCTYLYPAFSLKDETEGLNADEAEAVKRWRRAILDIAIEEMGHLAAVWNITSAVGGAPRFGRVNFPIDPGYLPAGIVVKLAPFSEEVLQHFVYLERPHDSKEPEGKGFESLKFSREPTRPRLTPMGFDYDTVGDFYEMMQTALDVMSERLGEKELFCGDPALQLSPAEVDLHGAKQVLCTKTAKQACLAIVTEGEGASEENPNSHFTAINGGPHFKLDEAISFTVDCDGQDEVDYYWESLLADGGTPSQCGWLKDRYGLSWQVTPKQLIELTTSADKAQNNRVFGAMMKMSKIIVADLERAAKA